MIGARAHGYLLPQLVRAAAGRWPDHPAVRTERGSLTYRQLDAAADGVAAVLTRLGVRLGDRVGVHLEKSVEAVAALHGIMRAGAAYVPIDPGAPPQRAAYVAADCDVSAIIGDAGRIGALRAVDARAAPRGIVVGADAAVGGFVTWADVTAAEPVPGPVVVDTDLAYILYTSGSTGRPKGVAISHRSSLTFVRWAQHTFGIAHADILANHAPLHFDLSTLDLFSAAAAGATVSIVPPAAAKFPVRLADWIRAERISVWYSVPSALSMLARYGDLEARPLSELRLILFAGEVFPVRYLGPLMRAVPGARFANLYGPTETNVCTYEEVDVAPGPDDAPPAIGRACANTRCEVRDEEGRLLVGIGAQGELVVRGSTVASGYWGDGAATARGFPEPFTYRTGDIVEVLDDSPEPRYRFLGRRDHMIKTRGYRVELGDVEAALYAHPQVRECVAVAVPDELMGNRLSAFCSVDGDVTPPELAAACRERVPPYMIPSHIYVLDELPRTPNDKFDRAGLAERAASLAHRSTLPDAARTH